MNKKSKKQMNKEIYERCRGNYKYNSDYDPMAEICCDNSGDKYDLYGTFHPTHDKTDYAAYPMRGYHDINHKIGTAQTVKKAEKK